MLSQLVTAIHPACVRYFVYADTSAASVIDVESSDEAVASTERPIEVLAANRVPLAFDSKSLVRTLVRHLALPVPFETILHLQPTPSYLAAQSRDAFLREHAFLI